MGEGSMDFFTVEGLLVGLLALAVGLAFAFYGFRVFLILLPIWGFFAGFLVGADAMTLIFGDGFLVEVTSWVVGFGLGLVFAVLSYLYYWVAVVLLGGALGYQLTIGLLQWIGFDAEGFIAFILALVGGAVFALGFIVLRMPAVLVVVATALSGAGAAIAGVIVGLGLVPLSALNGGIFGVHQAHDLGVVWVIAAIAVAFAGAIYQTRMMADMSTTIMAESYRNPGLDDGSSGAAAV
jgi:hypothetical protein